MATAMTYEQIYRALFSEGIEEYVPDGASLSHPVLNLWDGRVADSFLVYSVSRDGTRYTAPTARILIDAEKKQLLLFQSAAELPFSVYDGTDYFEDGVGAEDPDTARALEEEYQKLYMAVRAFAFRQTVGSPEKELIVRYLKSLKKVEPARLQPFLYELGMSFFQWVGETFK